MIDLCSHRDIERGTDEFTPDRCRACFAAVFPTSIKPPSAPRLTDVEAQHLAASVVAAPASEVPIAIGRLAAKVLELLARVPHDALAPQPPPANPPRGEPVWPLVIAEAAGNEAPPDLVSLMRARDQQGRAKYGVPLCANDGRDTTMDALQEALDLIVYLRKRRAEGRGGSEWWEYEVVCVARSLLAELEIEKKHAEGER